MPENEPHRPPKYVDGEYKPHFGDPDADYAIYYANALGGELLELSLTDSDGDAAGVVRTLDGKPRYEGVGHIVGHIHDGEIHLRTGNYVDWNERIDKEDVRDLLSDE